MRSALTISFDPRATHLGLQFQNIGIDLQARTCDQDCIIEATFFPSRSHSPSLLIAMRLDKVEKKRAEWKEVRHQSVVYTWTLPSETITSSEAFLILKTVQVA